MKIFFNRHKLFGVIFCLALAIPAFADRQTGDSGAVRNDSPAQGSSNRMGAAPQKTISIDFNDVDINVFIKFISQLTGRNFVVDQSIKGKVTIISPGKISIEEAYKVFESVLEVHNYTAIKAGEIIKIIPSPYARTRNMVTKTDQTPGLPEDRMITQIIPLRYANPEDIRRLFAPLISKSSIVLAYQPTNTLIVTDMQSNINRLLKILKTIDVTGVGQEISVIPLKHALATKMVAVVSNLFQAAAKTPKSVHAQRIKFVADERTNTIIVLAGSDYTQKIKKLIDLLDKETPPGKETIHVYFLENANAEELAKVLQEIPSKKETPVKGLKPSIVSSKVRITADKATNSLIIMAEKDEYQVLEEMIKKLDMRRAMVYIECLIMEVNVDRNFQLGVEWSAARETSYDASGSTVYAGGGFSGSGQYDNTLGLLGGAAGIAALPTGFSFGVFSEAIRIGNVLFPNVGAIVQAFKNDKDVHILSTPQILTMDNEEAKISVGKNIPYLTKSGSSEIEAYNTYEYKDVGINLQITPHISKDRQIRLKIVQELTKLDSVITSSTDRPTTLKRTVDTTVIVDDKNTIVLGGLIDDSFSKSENRVPCLGSVPLLGWLFSSVSDTTDKTNLFFFLTPHVVNTPNEAASIYRKKKAHIENLEGGDVKLYKKTEESPVQSKDSDILTDDASSQ